MKIHIVKQGDTLYELAKKYHVELDKLIAINPQIANPDEIDVGMKVKIPTPPKAMVPSEGMYKFKHVVKQGDTLWKLSKAWDVPLADLIAANPQLKNPNVLLSGEIVYIPNPESGGAENQPVQTPIAETPPLASPAMPETFHPPLSEAHPEMPQPTGITVPPMTGAVSEMPPLDQAHMAVPPMPMGEEAPVAQHAAMEPGWQFEPHAHAPLLAEPFGGVKGWEPEAGYPQAPYAQAPYAQAPYAQAPYAQAAYPNAPYSQTAYPQAPYPYAAYPHAAYPQAVHPFAQANVPAVEAFAGAPELPKPPSEPFDPHWLQHGSYPFQAAPVMPAYEAPMAQYPFANTGDCGCTGPKLDLPGGYGIGGSPYASPLHPPYMPGMTAMPGEGAPHMIPPYGSIPIYPFGEAAAPSPLGGVQLETTEKEKDIDISLREGKQKAEVSSVSSVKKAKPKSARAQLEQYLRNIAERRPERVEQKPNRPWINV